METNPSPYAPHVALADRVTVEKATEPGGQHIVTGEQVDRALRIADEAMLVQAYSHGSLARSTINASIDSGTMFLWPSENGEFVDAVNWLIPRGLARLVNGRGVVWVQRKAGL